MRKSMNTPQMKQFTKRALVAAMFLGAGQAVAGNSFDVLTDYYSAQHFDELSHARFVELMVKSEDNQPLAKQYADQILPTGSVDSELALLRSSHSNLIENAERLVSEHPEKLFVVHKELKSGSYPKPLAIEALYKIHRAYDQHFETYAKAHAVEETRVVSVNVIKAPATEVPQESVTTVKNVDVDRFDSFTVISAPSETLSLIDESQLIHEPKHAFVEPLSEAPFDPLDLLALMPLGVCERPEQAVEAELPVEEGHKLFADDLVLEQVRTSFYLFDRSSVDTRELLARKDDDTITMTSDKQTSAVHTLVYLKEDEAHVEQGESLLWVLGLAFV